MMNVGNPQEAFGLSFIPNDGVGLARLEFIINNYIRVHPMALLDYDELEEAAVKTEIDRLTAGYADKPQFFVDKLAEGVATIAAAFYPNAVIVRLSDFKTNEYANLLGGEPYEPAEENPMLGFRGASRYYHPTYRDGFALECRALKRVRDEMGLTNVELMVPFVPHGGRGPAGARGDAEERPAARRGRAGDLRDVRDPDQRAPRRAVPRALRRLLDRLERPDAAGLGRGPRFGDRGAIFDERNPAVKEMIAAVIRAASQRAVGKYIGICGQAPSDYPEFARFLVEEGIDSISLNPDAVMKTTLMILETEREEAA
ncbi:MAG: hypothetical protein MPW14_19850 [Candidatus Manganitrophus sp.]|nr:MAG: hypothetical protein MPW14_19850 [Candidatus Manganitrophus sp.]